MRDLVLSQYLLILVVDVLIKLIFGLGYFYHAYQPKIANYFGYISNGGQDQEFVTSGDGDLEVFTFTFIFVDIYGGNLHG